MFHGHAPLKHLEIVVAHTLINLNTPLNTCKTRVRGEYKKVCMFHSHAPLIHLKIVVAHTLINLNIPLNTCKTRVCGESGETGVVLSVAVCCSVL